MNHEGDRRMVEGRREDGPLRRPHLPGRQLGEIVGELLVVPVLGGDPPAG
jgi:hypothetical protein